MIFHLLTIQNQNSDDSVFHGFDYDNLRLQVAAYCRDDWHHGMACTEPIPLDREEQIEAFFLDHDRLFLIEQEFTLDLPEPYASASPLLHSVQEMLHYLETPGDYDSEELTAIMEFAADLDNRLTPPDPDDDALDEGNPDCTACNDGSCPWCQAEKQASEAPLSPLDACKFALSCILDAEEMEEIDEDAFSETKRTLRAAIAAATV